MASRQQKRTRTDPEAENPEDRSSKRRRTSSQVATESKGTKRTHNEERESENSSEDVTSSIERLFTAAGRGNLFEVKCLIRNGSDVNVVDKDGNTPLHCAVKGGYLEVVKEFLLNNTVIISKENNENETPLDIAIHLNKNNIIEVLGDKIVDNVLKNLENLDLKEPQLPSSQAPNDNGWEKVKGKIEKKVRFCLTALKELTNNEKDIKKFTYKNANIFMLFLEAFALQDVEYSKFDKEKRSLIEDYFEKGDNGFIKGLRDKFMHRKDKEKEIFTDKSLQDFVVKPNIEAPMTKFFTDLKDYVQRVHEKLRLGQRGQSQKYIQEILTLDKGTGNKSETVLDLFRSLVKVAYNKNSNSEDLEKSMFDLTVNIIPHIGNDLKEGFNELDDLRNELIHNFHKFPSVDSRIDKLKKAIFGLRSKLFKYCSSQEMHNKLCEAQLGEEADKIISGFSKELKDLEKKFHDKDLKLSDGEANSFEHVFSGSLFPERDGKIEDLVRKYLRFMIVIDRERIDDEEVESENSVYNKELSNVERREIFEGFVRLEQQYEAHQAQQYEAHQAQQYEEMKHELKRKFVEYGIDESSFNEAIFCLEGNNAFDEKVVDKVASIVKGLKSLRHSKELETYQFSNHDIISLCDSFMKEKKDVFHLSNHKDLLRKYNLPETTKKFIENSLSSLVNKNEIEDIQYITSVIVRINVAKVVNNILHTFYNAYHKYQIKFDNVEGVFNDKTFLNFLVMKNVELGRNKVFEFINKHYVFWIIKKLLRKEYTAPYIASLIIKVQSDSVIEKYDLRMLIEILLKENTYTSYLNELLHVKSKKPNFSLYEVVCEILEKGQINDESIRVILGDPEHAGKFLDIVGNRISAMSSDATIDEPTKKVLKLLNDVVLELIYKGENDVALKMLKILGNEDNSDRQSLYEKLLSKKLIENSDDLLVDCQLNEAKAKNVEGKEKEVQAKAKTDDKEAKTLYEEAKSLYQEALNVLDKIPESNSPRSLLALSRKGYIYSLLEQYDESYKVHNNLYNEIKKLALGEDSTALPDSKEIYTKIKESKNYQDLLDSSDECRKYLNIASIKKSIAYSKLQKRSQNEQKELKDKEEALKIYKQVLSLLKEDSGEEYKTILPIRKKIAFTHHIIGKQKSMSSVSSVSQYYFQALEEENKVLEKELEIYGNYPIQISRSFIIKCLQNIAFEHRLLGRSLKSIKHYENAENIFGQIYQIEKILYGEEDDRTKSTKGKLMKTTQSKEELFRRASSWKPECRWDSRPT